MTPDTMTPMAESREDGGAGLAMTPRHRLLATRYIGAKHDTDPRLSSEELDALAALLGLLRAPAPASDAAAVVEAARGLPSLASVALSPLVARLELLGAMPADEDARGRIGSYVDACREAAVALRAALTPPAASAGHGGERVGGDGWRVKPLEWRDDDGEYWRAEGAGGDYCIGSAFDAFWYPGEWGGGDRYPTLEDAKAAAQADFAARVRACLVQAPPAEEAPWTQAEWDASEAEGQAFIDRAWETYKTALPVAKVINDNQPGWTFIAETAPNVTLMVGTELYLHPVPPGAPSAEPAPAMGVQEAARVLLEALAEQNGEGPWEAAWASYDSVQSPPKDRIAGFLFALAEPPSPAVRKAMARFHARLAERAALPSPRSPPHDRREPWSR